VTVIVVGDGSLLLSGFAHSRGILAQSCRKLSVVKGLNDYRERQLV
jgi:hypothetical protein